ncbi:MAG: hypothetical protein J4F97_02485, partial [Pseudomonadales bacterium]|nr:hypothetical protein [Pseudomonadales bacterium]
MRHLLHILIAVVLALGLTYLTGIAVRQLRRRKAARKRDETFDVDQGSLPSWLLLLFLGLAGLGLYITYLV